jgi:protein-S-isoprenylcysteine O-methyltransferase Ste14
MFGPVNSVLSLIFWLISIGAFVMSVWALVHAARTPTPAFPAAGKQTKVLWLVILGFATLFTFAAAVNYGGMGTSLPSIFTIAAIIAAGIYLADVKPAVNENRGGGTQGPYGPW